MPVRRLAILALFGLAGCATIAGAGRDLQSAGRVIERESYEASR